MEFYNKKAFGLKIREIRNARNLTRDNINQLTGISKRALVNIESGESIPKLETLILLSICLKVDLISIFKEQSYLNSESFYKNSRAHIPRILETNFEVLKKGLKDYSSSKQGQLSKSEHLIQSSLNRELDFIDLYRIYDNTTITKVEETSEVILSMLDESAYDYLEHECFDYIDFRVSIILGDMFRKKGDFNRSVNYYDMIIDKIDESYLRVDLVSELKMMVHLGYATVYHRLVDHQKVIEHAEIGLNMALETNNHLMVPNFYFRLLISHYRLDYDYKRVLEDLLMYLISTKNQTLIDLYLRTWKKQYNEIYQLIVIDERLYSRLQK